MKKTYNITAFSTGGANVPKVVGIQLDEVGNITIQEPDLTELDGRDYSISYLLNINGNDILTQLTFLYIGNYLIEGKNEINVKVVLELTDEDGKTFSQEFEGLPFTPLEELEFSEVFSGHGDSKWLELENYTGTQDFINIPEFGISEFDGERLPILGLRYTGNAKKILGKFIKTISFLNEYAYRAIITKIDLPRLKQENLAGALSRFINLNDLVSFNTENTTSLYQVFYNCSKLEKIPKSSVANCTNFFNCFYGCTSLKQILWYDFKSSFDISVSTRFEREDLVTILNNLGTVSETQTLTMGSTNLAKLTSEDKAIATNKGWVLA